MNPSMVFNVTSVKNPMIIEGDVHGLSFSFYEYKTKWNITITEEDTDYTYYGRGKLTQSEYVPVGVAKIITLINTHINKEEIPTFF
jgi:hypothetical protein